MALYFVQHGRCLDKQVDPLKPLSPDGRREVAGIALHLAKMGITIKRVCHSGKTRARQTAQILADQLAGGTISQVEGMKALDSAAQFSGKLQDDDTIYVGHLPHLGKVVSYLTAGDEDAGVVQFVNGGVVCVKKNDAGYEINWYLVPSMCGFT